METKKPELTEDELLFLDTLQSCGFSYTSESNLKAKLKKHGMSESTYQTVKRKLLFARYIGSIYGNLTLEKKKYKPIDAKSTKLGQ